MTRYILNRTDIRVWPGWRLRPVLQSRFFWQFCLCWPFAGVLLLTLAACGSSSGPHVSTGEGGRYKVGKPYQINGVWYYPREDENYDATGIASWYGPNFHGKRTANGETFDQETLTAAHPTLPMPILVRVTNLDNGKSLIVRVNDRGPFVAGREIDLSRKSAELLGFLNNGTARVRVQYVGRAPLPGIPGTYATQVAGRETFTVPKPATEESESRVAVATPLTAVTGGDLPPPPGATSTASSTPGPAPLASAPRSLSLPDAFPAEPLPPSAPEEAKAAAGMNASVEQVPVPPVTQIYVQAGAFRNLNSAHVVRQKLAMEGLANAQVSQTMLDGLPIYRVRVGPLPDVGTADGVLQRVIQSGHPGSRIVVQ